MKKISILLCSISLCTASVSYADMESKTTPYGDNPNIFKVLAHKTGAAVQNTAEKVGEATENGIRKIKPKFDETVDNTKTYTAEQATIAKENTQKGIDTAVKKVEQTTDRVLGRTEYNVPIEQGSLSQPQIPTKTTHAVTATAPSTTVQNNTQAEPEITQQSIPTQNNTATQPSNADDDSGVPR